MSFVFGATSLTMYAPAKRSLRRSVHRSLAPGSVVGSDPLRAGRDPDASVDFFLNDAAAGIPDFSVKAQPQRHSPQKNKKTGRSRIGRTVSHRQVAVLSDGFEPVSARAVTLSLIPRRDRAT